FLRQASAFSRLPVTTPARRQCWVFCKAGAIWLVLRPPRPHKATPSFFPGFFPDLLAEGLLSAAAAFAACMNGATSEAAAAVFTKSRRENSCILALQARSFIFAQLPLCPCPVPLTNTGAGLGWL